MGVTSKQSWQFDAKLKVPTAAGNQASPADREVWIDTTAGKLCFRNGGSTVSIPLASEISSGLAIADSDTVDLTLSGSTLSAEVLDSPLLEGHSYAQVVAAAVTAIVAGASAGYDTLIELQALLTSEDSAISALTTSVGARAKYYAGAITSGSTTATVTHSLGLTNIHDFTCRIFVSSTGVEEQYAVVGATSNTLTVTDETGGNIPTGRRIFMTAGA